MNKRIDHGSLAPTSYGRKRARAPREEGVFFGVIHVTPLVAIVAAACAATLSAAICNAEFLSPATPSLPDGADKPAQSEVPAPWASTRGRSPISIAVAETRIVALTIDKDGSSREVWTIALPRGSEPWRIADIPTDWKLEEVAYRDGVFVAVGRRAQDPGVATIIATSADGVNWQATATSR